MATLAERLAEAEAALHDLQIGRGVRSITDQNGERVEYSLTSPGRLYSYIADLKRQLGTQISGPMRVFL